VPPRRALAWAVHLYTASGLVLAAVAAVVVVQGGGERLRWALLALFAATAVDATDGWLARLAGVSRHLPGFDGRRLDDIVDFHTYASVPLLLLWRGEVLGAGAGGWLLLPLLASAYGFSQAEVKTRDGYFRGFPSYWNVVALYLLLLRPAPGVALAVVVALSALTFVPLRFPYPSQPGRVNAWARGLGVAWAAVLLLVLLEVPAAPRAWLLVSLLYPAFHLVAALAIGVARRPTAAQPPGA
jgi:phosphatidylcholine synthase